MIEGVSSLVPYSSAGPVPGGGPDSLSQPSGPVPNISWITDRNGLPPVVIRLGTPPSTTGGAKGKEVGLAVPDPRTIPGETFVLTPGPRHGGGGGFTFVDLGPAAASTAMLEGFGPYQFAAVASAGGVPGIQKLVATTEDGTVEVPGAPRAPVPNPGGFGARRLPALAISMRPMTVADWSAGAAGIKIFVTSLGLSTGKGLSMTVVNAGTAPVRLTGDGFVLEPVSGATRDAVDREIRAMGPVGTATATLDGYCLEHLKQPPVAGMTFRLADAGAQRAFAPVRNILRATRRLSDLGQLVPDGGNPTAYVDSIRQWAIWTREQHFTAKGFADALVDHTRKNVLAAGQPWSAAVEHAVRTVAPGRWSAIARVLEAAAKLDGRKGGLPDD